MAQIQQPESWWWEQPSVSKAVFMAHTIPGQRDEESDSLKGFLKDWDEVEGRKAMAPDQEEAFELQATRTPSPHEETI